MRFKIYFNEKEQKLKINVLSGSACTSNHIVENIPNNLQNVLRDYLNQKIQQQDCTRIIQIQEEYARLAKERADELNKIREKYDSIIKDGIHSHMLEFPELYL